MRAAHKREPFWAVLIVVAADALAITAMLLVRRRAREGSFFVDGDRASGVFGVLATCFAIFAGFVIFLAFTTYDRSLAGADAEALFVRQQYETAQFLPPRTRDGLAGELVCYARSVVDQEWPEMELRSRSRSSRSSRSSLLVVAPSPSSEALITSTATSFWWCVKLTEV